MDRHMQRMAPRAVVPSVPPVPTEPYIRLPERLVRTYARDPLSIGIYAVVARCAGAAQGAVPLSPADLTELSCDVRRRDPAIARRLDALIEAGWISATASGSVKRHLLPCWGADRPCQFGAPHQGKPEIVRVCRVPVGLLDRYLGRIDPQPGRTPALITRLFDRPLLTLADIGTYVLTTCTNLPPTPQLRALGLFADYVAQPPQPDSALLRAAQQGALRLGDDATPVALSTHGWTMLRDQARAGQQSTQQRPPNGAANDSPNGVANHSLSGAASDSPNGSVNYSPNGSGLGMVRDRRLPRPAAANRSSSRSRAAAAWVHEDHGGDGSSSSIMSESHPRAGGGGGLHPRDQKIMEPPEPPIDAARAARLTELGIRHQRPLAAVPLALIDAWTAAAKHPAFGTYVRNAPGFTYAGLLAGTPPPTRAQLDQYARRRSGGREVRAMTWRDADPAEFQLSRKPEVPVEQPTQAPCVTLIPDEEVYRALRACAR